MKLVAISSLAFLASTLTAINYEDYNSEYEIANPDRWDYPEDYYEIANPVQTNQIRFNEKTLLDKLIGTIYSDDGDTLKVNLSPFYNVECNKENGPTICKGTYGIGNGVITFTQESETTETSYDVEYKESGQIKSLPYNVFGLYPEEIQNDEYEAKQSLSIIFGKGITLEQEGTINGEFISNSVSLSLENFAAQKNKYSAVLNFNRETQYPESIHDFYKNWFIPLTHNCLPPAYLPVGTEDLELNFSINEECKYKPFDKACAVKAVITGEKDDEDVGKIVAKYNVQSKKIQFEIKHNNEKLFWLGFLGIDKKEFLSLKYKLNGGSAVLVFQVVGPKGVGALEEAAATFFAPFGAFFSNIESWDNAAHIVAYFDKVTATWDNKLFNIYPMIKATKFESDLLKKYVLNGLTFQKWAENLTDDAADLIVYYGQVAGEFVGDARTYINDVTGPEGEAKFDSWFALLA